jgi:hypothetical protein
VFIDLTCDVFLTQRIYTQSSIWRIALLSFSAPPRCRSEALTNTVVGVSIAEASVTSTTGSMQQPVVAAGSPSSSSEESSK